MIMTTDNRALVEALEPFAKEADAWDGTPGLVRYDDTLELWQTGRTKVCVGDLRRARQALAALNSSPQQEGVRERLIAALQGQKRKHINRFGAIDMGVSGIGDYADAVLSVLTPSDQATEAREERVCEGCGTSHPDSDYAQPGPPYACCPERKMLTAKEWRDRALKAEDRLLAHPADHGKGDGWLPIVLCPTDGVWRATKLADGREVIAAFEGDDLGPRTRRWRTKAFSHRNPARATGEVFGGVQRMTEPHDTFVIRSLPEGIYPTHFRPNDTVFGLPAPPTIPNGEG